MRVQSKVLAWSLIGLLGGGAAVISLIVLALIVFIADVIVLEKSPLDTSYLTIVRLKGTATYSDRGALNIYEVRDGVGDISDAQLPWVVQPGDRLRVRMGETRILRLRIPTEGPALCSATEPCE